MGPDRLAFASGTTCSCGADATGELIELMREIDQLRASGLGELFANEVITEVQSILSSIGR